MKMLNAGAIMKTVVLFLLKTLQTVLDLFKKEFSTCFKKEVRAVVKGVISRLRLKQLGPGSSF
jgi:hypothetical protein